MITVKANGKKVYFMDNVQLVKINPPVYGQTIDPGAMFSHFMENEIDWQIDYSQATKQELLTWFACEVMVRVVRALSQSRSVSFLGKTFTAPNKEQIMVVAQQVEDCIAEIGNQQFTIDYDDHRGLRFITLAEIQSKKS